MGGGTPHNMDTHNMDVWRGSPTHNRIRKQMNVSMRIMSRSYGEEQAIGLTEGA